MSLLLTLEQGPRSQAVRQTGLDMAEVVIGRSPDADWQIDDPDMYVSRARCKITSEPDGYTVTDMSSSGLFIDDAGRTVSSAGRTVHRTDAADARPALDCSRDADSRTQYFSSFRAITMPNDLRSVDGRASHGIGHFIDDGSRAVRVSEPGRDCRPIGATGRCCDRRSGK